MKLVNIIGLTLLGGGVLLLGGFGFYELSLEFWHDDSIPMIIRLGVSAVGLGFFILLIGLTLERIKDSKREE